MAASPVLVQQKSAQKQRADTGSLFDKLSSRELVVAFSGPLGTGVAEVRGVIASQLQELGYEVKLIKVSTLIRAYSQHLTDKPDATALVHLRGAERYERFQQLGNDFRDQHGHDFFAYLVASHISLDRQKRHSDAADPRAIIPSKVAYLVDQLKHPAECQTLRLVYKDNFYLVGVLGSHASRKRRLESEGIQSAEAETIMERDRKQDEKFGQKLEKTLQLADFFVRNARSNDSEIRKATERFVKLVHGSIKVFPTRVEQGMYAAYSSALASACLSRQVGAAIHDSNGVLVATGCNDVPTAGGGLYQEGNYDDRCAFLEGGVCFNHLEKDAIRTEISDELTIVLKQIAASDDNLKGLRGQEAAIAAKLAQRVRSETRLNDLIEFSRAVHAEMDALVSIARSGSGRAQDGILFTTTYPCHNCARHIIAAGIRTVYFVEPYEKSLAKKLHSDAIEHDAAFEESIESWRAATSETRRVRFLHFEGVAPRRYLGLFAATDDRKSGTSGRVIPVAGAQSRKKEAQLLESYIEIEARLAQQLVQSGIDIVSVD